jgi:hypothetical protein
MSELFIEVTEKKKASPLLVFGILVGAALLVFFLLYKPEVANIPPGDSPVETETAK